LTRENNKKKPQNKVFSEKVGFRCGKKYISGVNFPFKTENIPK